MSEDGRGQPAPNVKPKPPQKEPPHGQAQWKKDKPPKARRSRSSEEGRGERGRRREAERRHGERRRRGRSEETKRARGGEGGGGGQAAPPQDEAEEAECAVCFCGYDNVFKTPKLLACGHTFCLECLARINVTSAELTALSCPVCRELTRLPHGHDLPRLHNNLDIIHRLPPDMRRALSVRFQRSKGKLVLKHPPPAPALPAKAPGGPGDGPGGHLSAAERGAAGPAVVDVGRPPSRIRGRLRRLFRSDRCYYAVVGSIISVTVVLMLVGLLAFVIVPRVQAFQGRPPSGNTSDQPGPGAPESP